MGLTVIDAGIVIAILDASDLHHAAATKTVRRALDVGEDLVLPASAFAECLVAPSRNGPDAVTKVEAFIDAVPLRVEPATRAIARAAADLRARHTGSLRLPDALVLATAIILGASRVVTTDAGWPSTAMVVEVLPTA